MRNVNCFEINKTDDNHKKWIYMEKLVSVVIPSYNREHTILRAVNSVLNQTYKQVEIIIVDDCSSDNTEDSVSKEFGGNSKVIFHRLKNNSGACHARNKGVELSHGDYVAFLDSDDEYLPKKIEKQILMLEKTGVDLCASDYLRIGKDGKETVVPTYDNQEFLPDLLYLNQITTGTLIGKRQCFVDTPFDESLPRYQDWDLVLRLAKKYSFSFLKENTLIQYFQPFSITNSTSHHKTYVALSTIFSKNKEEYLLHPKGYSQIMWLLGLHSIYNKGDRNIAAIWKGVVANGFSFHRFLIFVMVLCGNKSLVDNFL